MDPFEAEQEVARGSGTRATRQRNRARGMTRRQGRKRTSGRGRGGFPRLTLAQIERQQEQRRAERQQNIRGMINTLATDRLRELLLLVAERQPGIFFDIWEEQPRAPQPTQAVGQPGWCSCGKCRLMPSVEENICCTGTPEHCLSVQPEMERLVLDPMVLGIAQAMRNDLLATNQHGDENRGLRHTAYRQYILWHHGRLGQGNRRVIPSCVVTRIRERFPDPLGAYTGYMPSRLA